MPSGQGKLLLPDDERANVHHWLATGTHRPDARLPCAGMFDRWERARILSLSACRGKAWADRMVCPPPQTALRRGSSSRISTSSWSHFPLHKAISRSRKKALPVGGCISRNRGRRTRRGNLQSDRDPKTTVLQCASGMEPGIDEAIDALAHRPRGCDWSVLRPQSKS